MALNSNLLQDVAEKLRKIWEESDAVKSRPGLLLNAASIAFGLEKISASVALLKGALEVAKKVDGPLLTLVQNSIKDFQRKYSLLEEDGILGSRTLSVLNGLLGCPGGNDNKKPKTPAGFGFKDAQGNPTQDMWFMFFIESTPNIPNAHQLIHNAWDSWKKVALVRSREVDNLEDSNVVIRKKVLDGPNGTLGQSHVGPVSKDFRLELEMDDREIWTASKFQGAVCHEIGHLLGLNHLGRSGNLMSEFIGPDMVEPQLADIQSVRDHGYGPPQTMQTVDVDPTPSDLSEDDKELLKLMEELRRRMAN